MTDPDKPDLTKRSTPDAGSTDPGTSGSADSDGLQSGSGPGWNTNASFGEGPGAQAHPSYPSPGTFPEPPAGDTAAFGYPVGEYGSWNREPETPSWSDDTSGYTGYGQQQYGQQPPYGQQYGQQPPYGRASGFGVDPSAPFGRHPASGEPFGDKSKVTAGVLQLVPLLFGLPVGLGRFYIGSTSIAVGQLVLFAVSVVFTITLIGAIVGIPLYAAVWLWCLIDGIVILAGSVRDGNGRLLKP